MNYEYGITYKTNGIRPALPDDVIVEVKGIGPLKAKGKVSDWNWEKIKSFCIVDKFLNLPSVGSTVEFHMPVGGSSKNFDGWKSGTKVEVLAHKEGIAAPVAIVWNPILKEARGVIAGALRAVSPKIEAFVDAAYGKDKETLRRLFREVIQ